VGLAVFGRNEAEAADMVAVGEVLSEQVEDQLLVEFVLILLSLRDGEDKSSSLGVAGVFPLGLYPFLEVLDGVDPSPLLLDLVAG